MLRLAAAVVVALSAVQCTCNRCSSHQVRYVQAALLGDRGFMLATRFDGEGQYFAPERDLKLNGDSIATVM